jgi:hypothetical protein
MKDDEHPSDYLAHPPVPKLTSMPAAAKTIAVAGAEVKSVLTLVLALVGTKWGYVPPAIFCGLLIGIPMADYARRKAQGSLDLQGILEMIDRMRR